MDRLHADTHADDLADHANTNGCLTDLATADTDAHEDTMIRYLSNLRIRLRWLRIAWLLHRVRVK